MAFIRQPSFSSGELSPTLHGRSDLAVYARGLKKALNGFISKHGAFISRPGMRFVAEVKDSAVAVRLIPFNFSDSTSYVLEFGDLYVRFYRDALPVRVPYTEAPPWSAVVAYSEGDYVSVASTVYRAISANTNKAPATEPTFWLQSDILELSTPYTSAQLSRITYAQSGDVLFLAHGSHSFRELSRESAYVWSLAASVFANRTTWLSDLRYTPPPGRAGPYLGEPVPIVATTEGRPREWAWKVTAIGQETATGRLFESSALPVESSTNGAMVPVLTPVPANVTVAKDSPVTVRWHPISGLLSVPSDWQEWKPLAYRIYRGRGDLFGFVGETKSTEFVDVGDVPDYSRQPPAGRNPFQVFDYLGALVRTEEPIAVGFFEGRLVLAGTDERPAYVGLSRSDDFTNFDAHALPAKDDAVEYELASRRREEIRWVLGAEKLLIGTDAGIWSLAGADGGPVLANEIAEARVQQEVGTSHLDPLRVESSVLYVRSKGAGVRDLFYDSARRSHVGSDLSFFSAHLFEGLSIVAWAYAEDPWGLVWAVRSDGVLLSLTYAPGQEVLAWTKHETLGTIESVCAVPETTEDGVYVVVRRFVAGADVRYVERLSNRLTSLSSRLVAYVPPVSPVAFGGGLIFVPDTTRYVTGNVTNGMDLAEVVCLDSSRTFRISPPWHTQTTYAVGDYATVAKPEIHLYRSITGSNLGNDPETDAVNWEEILTGPYVLTGLGHLEGYDVSVVADGEVSGPYIVQSGAISLDLATVPSTVHVGLLFQVDVESLNLAVEKSELRGKQKTTTRVLVDVEASRGLYAGEDFDNLREWEQRDVADSYGPLSLFTGQVEIAVDHAWQQHGRIALRQSEPLPLTVLGFTREVDVGG